MVSFGMSVFWIAVLSFGMVTLVARAGCLIGIDSYTMGLIVIAVGTSIPVSIYPATCMLHKPASAITQYQNKHVLLAEAQYRRQHSAF